MRMAIGFSLCLFGLVGCASPQPVSPPPPSAQVARVTETEQQRAQRLIQFSADTGEPINTTDGEKLLCRQENITNTRLKNKKICMTEEQWAERNNNAKDAFRDAVRTSNELPPRGN